MRKRKSSHPSEADNLYSADGSASGMRGEAEVIRVVPISFIVWLCVGLIIGCVCGGPWTTLLEEKLYGYRWNHIFRCIIETPDDSGGYGADFCRVPVDCKVCRDVDKIDEYHVSELTVDMFQQHYAYSDRPVVIRNATLHWPAMEVLDFQWLKEAYLSDPEILDYEERMNNKEYEKECWYNNYKSLHLPSLRSVFRMSVEDVTSSLWYVGWAVCQAPVASLLHDLYERPAFLHPDSTPPKKPWIFIGTPGPGAHFHIDNVDQSSWQAQISGSKTWYLRPPPECWWTCSGVVSTVLHPGDIIVVNTNVWFHSTNIEGPDLSLVITNEFD